MFTTMYNSAVEKVTGFRSRASEAPFSLAQVTSLDPSIARVLWAMDAGIDSQIISDIRGEAAMVRERLAQNQVFAVVPVYVTSICHEQCVYCNFRSGNREDEIERLRLSDADLKQEVKYLIDEKGLRALELVYATDPMIRVDAMCRHVEMLSKLLESVGSGCVGINAEAFDESEYSRLRNAGLSFCVLWQETYDRERYRELHPGRTKKTNFEYRLGAYERMLAGGIRRIGMGVLSGLADWRSDWAMLMQHEAYLKNTYGVEASILGIPRLKHAAGAILKTTAFVPSREDFIFAVSVHSVFSPRSMPFVNTREDWDTCVELSRGGGVLFTFNCTTIPGGYSLGHRGYQFPTGSFDAPIFRDKLKDAGLKPIFDWRFVDSAKSKDNVNLFAEIAAHV